MKPGKIAFFRPETWPLGNVKLAEALQQRFPENEIEVIDVFPRIRCQKAVMAANALAVFQQYGHDLILRRKRFKRCFWRTPFIFNEIHKDITAQLRRSNYLFSFQMQSLFDVSDPGVPHFLYTDHAHIAERPPKHWQP